MAVVQIVANVNFFVVGSMDANELILERSIRSKLNSDMSMTNNSWWKGLPKEIEIDLEILSDSSNIK